MPLRQQSFSAQVLHGVQGQYAKAEPLYVRALAISEKAFGSDHPNVADLVEDMAELYRLTGRPREAEAFSARARRIRATKP